MKMHIHCTVVLLGYEGIQLLWVLYLSFFSVFALFFLVALVSSFCFLDNCLKGTAQPIIVYTLILSVVLADQSSPTSEAVPPADGSLWLLSQIKTFPF